MTWTLSRRRHFRQMLQLHDGVCQQHATPEQREAMFVELWRRGKFNWLIPDFSDNLMKK